MKRLSSQSSKSLSLKKNKKSLNTEVSPQLLKAPSGIDGLDEITNGGFPKGRPTLICGGAGSGKTLFCMKFLLRGATEYGEPGVLMTFEESANEIAQNVRSLNFDVNALVSKKKLLIDHVALNQGSVQEVGNYDLEPLFVRLNYAIDSVKAKRVVLDSIEALFASLKNQEVLRSELRRLFLFLKKKGVTVLITGEKGEGRLTRNGIEEYISDCVIFLDNRVIEQVCTRRLRIVKYRGTSHGTNEYPFLIHEEGISVLPITGYGLQHEASKERIPTGIPKLDEMLGGKGYFKGSTILVSGGAGSGKTSFAAYFAKACCERDERVVYFSFEESPSQIIRNLSSINVHLGKFVDKGLLKIISVRPSATGLETHLLTLHKIIKDFKPVAVIIDPITGFRAQGNDFEVQAMITRMIDLLKMRKVTSIFTSLIKGGENQDSTDVAVSSIIDTWIVVREIESMGQRRRGLYILKSRGMAHSGQVREFRLSDKGVDLL